MRPIAALRASGVALCALATFVVIASCHHRARPRVVPNVAAPPVIVPASARRALALTIYSGSRGAGGDGYAFIREERAVRIPAGRFSLRALDVGSTIVPETTRFELVSFTSDAKPQLAGELYEQRYLYDQLGPARLLEKSEGQRVSATWWAGGRSGHEQTLTGTIVSGRSPGMIRTDAGEILALPSHARVSFAAVPPDLVEKPTLSWNVGSYEASDALLRLTYRAGRFDWQADYVVVLDRAASTADIEGWVTVVNQGDVAFDNAKLQLAAGEIHSVTPTFPGQVHLLSAAASAPPPAEPQPHATEEKLGEVHLYTIDHPTSLPARSSKQVRFVLARSVPLKLEARTSTRIQTGSYDATLTAEIEHGYKGGLAVPLPAGTVRTSTSSSQAILMQIGEQPTDHTPAGEPWRVPIAADPEQLTRVIVKNEAFSGRDRDGSAIYRCTVRYELVNRSRSPRHRRVVIEPDRGRILKLSQAPELRSEGPSRAVIETDLPAGATRAIELTLDRVDPYNKRHSGIDNPNPDD
ncbi:MAG: hypothetical protein HY898_33175 [Deltaproteobacteria bacterium]|nr:hypothetical protein [Deltaproteobacteria bacterium]